MITLENLRQDNLILFESISGSRAYGLELPHSDYDVRGVFLLPKPVFYGLHYTEQVHNEKQDIVFYELKRFFQLLLKNNPNVLELLNMPQDCIVQQHPLYKKIDAAYFLSRRCRYTFGEYALAQIKKARGLNKKISKPVAKKRKSVLDFCFVAEGQGAIPLKEWLKLNDYRQEHCGLVKLTHMRDMYGLYYDHTAEATGKGVFNFKGISLKEDANDVLLSSVPPGLKPEAFLYFNRDGYSTYCKEYKVYWEWVEKRNPERYENTIRHGQNYDAKNMMHTFRLLDMAKEIAIEGEIKVRRPNREWLFKVRRGELPYEELLHLADEKLQELDEAYTKTALPETPDESKVEALLIELREELYALK